MVVLVTWKSRLTSCHARIICVGQLAAACSDQQAQARLWAVPQQAGRKALMCLHTAQVTAILYANPGWCPADGGKLRLWPPRTLEAAPSTATSGAGTQLALLKTSCSSQTPPSAIPNPDNPSHA